MRSLGKILFACIISIEAILCFEIMFAINCGQNEKKVISTKFFNYTDDNAYQGLTSRDKKRSNSCNCKKPTGYSELQENYRTVAEGYNQFGYRPMMPYQGDFIAIFTMSEFEVKRKGDRIFRIKLGEDVVHTVDIFAEVGFSKALHKWIQFSIRGDILYWNGTTPTLNSYNYVNTQVKFMFEGIVNQPIVQSFVLLSGVGARNYLKQFLQHEQDKHIPKKEYLATKYRNHNSHKYSPITYSSFSKKQTIIKQETILLLFRSFGFLVLSMLALHHHKIFKKINEILFDKLKCQSKTCCKKTGHKKD